MIIVNDILSKHPESKKIRQVDGFVVKCVSPRGICFQEKTKAKNFFKYIVTEYFIIGGGNKFSRNEYFLPNGELIYVKDTYGGASHEYKTMVDDIEILFKQQFGKDYLSFRKSTGKNKPKVKKCSCRKNK